MLSTPLAADIFIVNQLDIVMEISGGSSSFLKKGEFLLCREYMVVYEPRFETRFLAEVGSL